MLLPLTIPCILLTIAGVFAIFVRPSVQVMSNMSYCIVRLYNIFVLSTPSWIIMFPACVFSSLPIQLYLSCTCSWQLLPASLVVSPCTPLDCMLACYLVGSVCSIVFW